MQFRGNFRVCFAAIGLLSTGMAYGSNLVSLAVATESALSFSTFVGQGGSDTGSDIATDNDGNVYITGSTRSSANPVQSTETDNTDIFVAKLTPDGSQLVYLTTIGGSADDFANAMCIDTSGSAVVTGGTRSTDFPVASATQSTFGGRTDAFVVRLDQNGTPTYVSYLGGEFTEAGEDIACHDANNVVVTGRTNSPGFPLQAALQSDLNPTGGDVFITRIDVTGAIIFSTFLGGTHSDTGRSLAVDGPGNIFVTGVTDSTDFPLVNPMQSEKGGLSPTSPDAFVAKISADGSTLMYSTFLGGNLADQGNGIAVDADGNAVVIGSTYSADFPTANAHQPTHLGRLDVFVARLTVDGSALDYSTFIGGQGSELGNDVAVDHEGNVFAVGSTDSPDFPLNSAVQSGYGGGARDAFITKVDPDGAMLVSSFFGGSLLDEATGVTTNGGEATYVSGRTTSATLPIKAALQPTYGGGSFDPFLIKMVNLFIPPQFVPAASLGRNYSHALNVLHGEPPYSWSLIGGSLPAGLSLGADGVISGNATAGGFIATFTVQAMDNNGDTATRELKIQSRIPNCVICHASMNTIR